MTNTQHMPVIENKVALVIVAHPDDETLWSGGTILEHPSWKWHIITLTRGSDDERSEKFRRALTALGATGAMGDMDDGPEQTPLNIKEVQENIVALMPVGPFDLVISHNPAGEYTRHLRHEETGEAVIELWHGNRIPAKELWLFAYEDGGRKYFPRAIMGNAIPDLLSESTWLKKYHIIKDIYGFNENSWEAQTTPREESFLKITNPAEAMLLLKN